MKKFYQVTEIEFDWNDEEFGPPGEFTQECLIDETKDELWDAKDEEHLMDIIADDVGYCVKSIKYDLV
ncbi:hypothetical protein [Synechococcus phage S-B05]|nr:hypothetical protein [Synechococcus phage S-B05]QCW22847.1 hypothetical protein [Synechococcus phage S-B05]